MLQTELIFFVQRDNHIILFLYINIERGVLVVFQLWQRFLVFLQGLFPFPFQRTHFRFQVLTAKNGIGCSVFIVFFSLAAFSVIYLSRRFISGSIWNVSLPVLVQAAKFWICCSWHKCFDRFFLWQFFVVIPHFRFLLSGLLPVPVLAADIWICCSWLGVRPTKPWFLVR